MPELPVSKRGISKMGSISIPEEHPVLDEQNGGEGTPLTPPPPPGLAWDYFFMNMPEPGMSENDEEEEVEEGSEDDHNHENAGSNVSNREMEFQTPEKMGRMEVVVEEEEEVEMDMETRIRKQFMHSNTAPAEIRGASKVVVGMGGGGAENSVNWIKVLKDIDDHFLKASECVQGVSKLLEANRYQYHKNFADATVPVDHAARVMRVITWNRPDVAGNGKNDHCAEENETHAIVLDKLLAWEKKLCDEVKAGELMKLEYQRKVALLTKQKKRGASSESLEKTKAAVSHLHTRYIVDMQSMDSTVSEVNDLRDCQLYPKLVELVDGMANMWENICIQHDNQLKIIMDLKSLDISVIPRETTRDHYTQTIELLSVVEGWQTQFVKLVAHEKSYIGTLNSWLKLNLISIESSLKEKISSPPRIRNPPIQALLHSWHDSIENLPDELVKTAISCFAATIKNIILHQEEEMKLKEKCEETRREFLRKNQAFEEWFHKHNKRSGRAHHNDTADEPGGAEGVGAGDEIAMANKDPILERRFVVESLKKRLDEEMEDHRKHCLQTREKSMGSLKTRLPELFRALSDYSHACADTYNRLRCIALSHNH